MADLKIRDKLGENHIHEPDRIWGYLYIDGEYKAVIHVLEDSRVDLTSNFHSLMMRYE